MRRNEAEGRNLAQTPALSLRDFCYSPLIDKPTTDQMHFLLELTERRYDNSSTIYCSQYPVDEWHRRMGGGAHAESVMDRIVHNAVRIQMGDVNMREMMAKRKVE